MPRDIQIGTRVDEEIKAALDGAVKTERRSMNDLINLILEDWLREKGYLQDKR